MSIDQIHTQLLYEFVNWRISGHEPVPPIGNVAHYNSKRLYCGNKEFSHSSFRTAALKIAEKAAGKMSEEDFHMLLFTIPGDKRKEDRQNLCTWRRENPDDGLEIIPPFPFNLEELRQSIETPCDRINRYTPTGRRLLMDFVDYKNIGFDPKIEAGCVNHWRSREIYQTVSKSAFRHQARLIARDVICYIPDSIAMEKMFEEAVRKARVQKDKLRIRNKK